MPLVSIALCTYNGEKYLKEQLDSLVNQTYSNIEIVAVDDCSTDSTTDILRNYATRYSFIKVFRNNINLGLVKNFEKALTLCSGSLIALSDQDDIWDPDKISLQAKAIGDNLFIYHDSEFIDENGKSMNKKISDKFHLHKGIHPEVFLFSNCISGHSILMKKELLDKAIPFPEGYAHDQWLAYVATNLGNIAFIPHTCVKYRLHFQSNTDILNIKKKQKSSSFQNFEKQRKWLKICASFPYNRNPDLIHLLYRLFNKRVNSFISFSFAWILFKNRETLFIHKKNYLSEFNYFFKQIWGRKLKELIEKK